MVTDEVDFVVGVDTHARSARARGCGRGGAADVQQLRAAAAVRHYGSRGAMLRPRKNSHVESERWPPSSSPDPAAFARLAGTAPIPASSGKKCAIDSTAAATANSTEHSTRSSVPAAASTPKPGPASAASSAKALTNETLSAALKSYLARSIYRQLETTPTAS